jgi:hypothetical protein
VSHSAATVHVLYNNHAERRQQLLPVTLSMPLINTNRNCFCVRMAVFRNLFGCSGMTGFYVFILYSYVCICCLVRNVMSHDWEW